MVSILTNKTKVIAAISDYLLSREVFKELGEPILFDEGDRFFCKIVEKKCIGFACLNVVGDKATLKYFYVAPEHRGNGIFSELYQEVENMAIGLGAKTMKAVSTNAGLPAYQKRGFEITKSWVNYHNIQKTLQ